MKRTQAIRLTLLPLLASASLATAQSPTPPEGPRDDDCGQADPGCLRRAQQSQQFLQRLSEGEENPALVLNSGTPPQPYRPSQSHGGGSAFRAGFGSSAFGSG
jgi:hypothetical protein